MPERRFKVVWTQVAAGDLLRLISWVAEESPQHAAALLGRIRQRARTLTTAPGRGRAVPELSFFGITVLRELVLRPYRIVYRVDGRTVLVLGVFDGRRELEDVLLERLTAPPER
jgi:plasmid stabilization system protein ParE